VLTLAVLTSCGDGDGGNGTFSPGGGSPTASDASPEATLPPIPAVDRTQVSNVMDALRTRDIETIRPFIGLRRVACAEEATPSGPPECINDETPGTEIDAFYISDCEGRYVRAGEVNQPLYALSLMEVRDVYRIPRAINGGYQYAAILTDTTEPREGMAWEAVIEAGQVIGLLYSCSLTPEELIQARGYTEQVPTPEPASETPSS
jgi:hypothetical protein